VHKLADGIAERKDNRLLAVDDGPTELLLNVTILGDDRFFECLFDEDGSHFTVRH
jgi:hypothetical protein